MVFCGEENGPNSSSPRFVIINDETYVEHLTACNVKRLILQHSLPTSEFGTNSVSVNEDYDLRQQSIPSCSYSGIHSNSWKDCSKDDCESDKEDELYIDCDSAIPRNVTESEVVINEKLTLENNAQCKKESIDSCGMINIFQKHIEEMSDNEFINLRRTKCLDKLQTDCTFVKFNLNSEDTGKAQRQEGNTKSYVMWFTNAPEMKMTASDHFPLIKYYPKTPSDMTIDATSNEKMTKCPYCNFKIHKAVLKHLLLHLRVCFCILCKKALSMKEAYVHLRGESYLELGCLKCSFKSKCQKEMQMHIFNAHKDSLLSQCGLCGYKTNNLKQNKYTLTGLNEHVENEHSVKQCNVSPWFVLIEYQKDQDLYHCPHCSHEVFNNWTDLLHHVSKCQLGEKLLKCNLCKFKHHSEIWMKLHIQTHSLHKYKCPYCKYKTNRHFMLKYHISEHHKRQCKKLLKLRSSSENSAQSMKKRKLN